MENELFSMLSYLVVAVVAVGVLVVTFYQIIHNVKYSKRRLTTPKPKACPNPNCIRCRNYRQVQKKAKQRLPWILKELEEEIVSRIVDHDDDDKNQVKMQQRLHHLKYSIENPLQACTIVQVPTVLMAQGLSSEEVVTKYHHAACEYVQQNNRRLETIFRQLIKNIPTDFWHTNDSPEGTWQVLQLMNQGTWKKNELQQQLMEQHHQKDQQQLLEDLFDFVQEIPGLMDNCLFGNVYISKIFPGTAIEPHCGPTNTRHRLQYVLEVPNNNNMNENDKNDDKNKNNKSTDPVSFLQVGISSKLTWNVPRDLFVFDDSFVHSVSYPNTAIGNKSADARTVLIVDLWHPDLTPIERTLIQHLYPPIYSENNIYKKNN